MSGQPYHDPRGLNAMATHTGMTLATLEHLILSTPSGELRNLLTEANIHAMGLDAKLQEIREMIYSKEKKS